MVIVAADMTAAEQPTVLGQQAVGQADYQQLQSATACHQGRHTDSKGQQTHQGLQQARISLLCCW
jgi:hypothetical protein